MNTKFNTQAKDVIFDRALDITLNQLAAAREIAIKLAAGHEPDPALVGGLVQAMATNYHAEMNRKVDPLRPEPKRMDPMATGKFTADMLKDQSWPSLGDPSR